MTKKQALTIMGMDNNYTKETLKSRYHSLMLLTHPDAAVAHDYPYEASDINVAYEYLLEHYGEEDEEESPLFRDYHMEWNAPVNESAYASRNIYHDIEDEDGEIIGRAIIDTGKFMWIPDEDFPTFLASVYSCSKKIIEEHDDKSNTNHSSDISLQAEISYLLIEQFLDASMILDTISPSTTGNTYDVYSIDAMLEITGPFSFLAKGSTLYPSRISKHRLYIKTSSGREVGYISFKDDKLYYCLIPIFERRAAKVKMQVASATCKYINHKKYVDVDMMIKLLDEDKSGIIESINKKIDQLLNSL